MKKTEIFGMLLIIMGILILLGYALYLFVQSIVGVPPIIRIGLTALMIGLLIILLSLVRERWLDMQREKSNK